MTERCSKKLWSNYGDYQCSHKGVVCRNGKWYCKQHDPGDHEKAQTWWEVRASFRRIDPVQVLSETSSTIKTKSGLSFRKISMDSWILPTFEEAKAYLVAHMKREVTQYARRLERAKLDLEAVRKLEEPTP